MTAMIRYQVLPELVLPAHVVRQLPPVTLAETDTFVPVLMTVRIRALIQELVRRFALQSAAFVAVAPRTSPGNETDATANNRIAEMNDVTTRVGSDGRPERRAGTDKRGTSCGRNPSFVQGYALDNHQMGPVVTGPDGYVVMGLLARPVSSIRADAHHLDAAPPKGTQRAAERDSSGPLRGSWHGIACPPVCEALPPAGRGQPSRLVP